MPAPLQPIFDWLDSITALTALLAIIAALYLIRMLWRGAKTAIPVVKTSIAFVEALFSMPAFMNETREQLQEIRHEVLPNKGRSLRDDVETLTLMSEEHGIRIERLITNDKSDHSRLNELEHTINRRRERRAVIQQEADSGSLHVYPADTSEE